MPKALTARWCDWLEVVAAICVTHAVVYHTLRGGLERGRALYLHHLCKFEIPGALQLEWHRSSDHAHLASRICSCLCHVIVSDNYRPSICKSPVKQGSEIEDKLAKPVNLAEHSPCHPPCLGPAAAHGPLEHIAGT